MTRDDAGPRLAKAFGRALATAIDASGTTIGQVAEKAGRSRTSIEDLLICLSRGETRFTLAYLADIAWAAGLKYEITLMKDTDHG